jgi:hypothetical protein
MLFGKALRLPNSIPVLVIKAHPVAIEQIKAKVKELESNDNKGKKK